MMEQALAHNLSGDLDDAAVRAILDGIVDPCSRAAGAPAGISEMGMVPDIHFEPGDGNKINIKVRLIVTHPFCMMSNLFVKEIIERLEAQPSVGTAQVDFDPGSLWTPDLMSPDYAERLEAARAKRRAAFAAPKAA
jgi:metal-sulfur cluster biosynthetic enzyme